MVLHRHRRRVVWDMQRQGDAMAGSPVGVVAGVGGADGVEQIVAIALPSVAVQRIVSSATRMSAGDDGEVAVKTV